MARDSNLTEVCSLSIVIVSYKVRETLLDCLHSLYEGGGLAGLPDAEVIVVDNASGDETPDAVRAEFPTVTMVALVENVGFAGGNNVGLAKATGQNLLLLNPDTLVPEGALAKCVAYLDGQPASVGAMSCKVASPDGSLQWECARRLLSPYSECCRALLLDRLPLPAFRPEAMSGWNRDDERPVESVLGAFVLLRRTVYEAIGGLDEQFFLMYEDSDYCKRIGDAGFQIRYWPGATITHLGGQSWKQERVETYANTHASALLYLAKHHPKSVKTVRFVHQVGMELKILLLRLNLLRRPGDTGTQERLAMAHAARNALRTGAYLKSKTGTGLPGA